MDKIKKRILYPCMLVLAVSIPPIITDKLPFLDNSIRRSIVAERIGLITTSIVGSILIRGIIQIFEYHKIQKIEKEIEEVRKNISKNK